MTAIGRSVPSSVAGVLAELELQRPTIVTRSWMEAVVTDRDPTEVIQRLRRLGWLLPLRVRGAWEFAPADRAGALSGGDPLIEVRALAEVRPNVRVVVGLESAAFLRSLSPRRPSTEVVVFSEASPVVKALAGLRRVDVTFAEDGHTVLDGLNVQTPAAILATVAVRPLRFRDWPGLGEWLPDAVAQTEVATLQRLLAGRSAAAWARAAYLLHRGGRAAAARQVLATRPGGRGPFYLGPRGGGVHDRLTDVVDSVLYRYV